MKCVHLEELVEVHLVHVLGALLLEHDLLRAALQELRFYQVLVRKLAVL